METLFSHCLQGGGSIFGSHTGSSHSPPSLQSISCMTMALNAMNFHYLNILSTSFNCIVCITCLEPNQRCLPKTCVSLCVHAVSKPEQGVSGSGTPTCPWDSGERGAAGNRWHCGWEQGHTLPTGLTSGAGAIQFDMLQRTCFKETLLRVKLLISSLEVSLTSLSLGFLIFQARKNLF